MGGKESSAKKLGVMESKGAISAVKLTICGYANGEYREQEIEVTPTPMDEQPTHKTLRDYATHKRVIHGPYSEGNEPPETEQDTRMRLDKEERKGDGRLAIAVIWAMAGLILAYVCWSIMQRL